MVQIRDINRVSGTVFDLPHAMSLSSTDCNVLLLSSRTLFFVQLFGTGEMDFLSRYASDFLDGNKYVLAEDSTELDDINDLVNNYELEVQPVTCDLVAELQNITLAIQQMAGADCSSCGSELDPDPAPAPTIGPGEDFETLSEFETYKCQAVNWLLDTLVDIFTKLDVYPIEFWTSATIGTASALITAILATTLVAGIFAIVAGAVVALVIALIAGGSFDLNTIKDTLTTERDNLACILFNGANAASAKANFLDALLAAGLSTVEVGLIGLILVDNVINNLFELNPDIVGHTITSACTGCGADCDLFFGKGTTGIVRGTGDLSKNGATRTLSSVFDVSAGFHYITVNVSEMGDGESLFVDCSNMAGSCSGTSNENWDFKPLSLSGFDNAGSSGTRCIDGDHTVMWTGSPPPLGVTRQVSWFEFISNTAFTMDCQMVQRP